MRLAVFSHREYERAFLQAAARDAGIELLAIPAPLSPLTAPLAAGCEAASIFVGDDASEASLRALSAGGCRLLALRCAGFNQVDLPTAARLSMPVVRVPEYSPHAVAEHTVGLVLMLDRRLHKAFNRVREGNFSLDGLLGFDLHGRTVGVVGTGKIGSRFAKIMLGFGCHVLAHDPRPDAALERSGVAFVPLSELLAASDIISLHCPLAPATHHLIDAASIALMKPGVMLVNTSRGGLVDTRAVIAALKTGQIGHLGLDVYEEEADLFFEDKSNVIIGDDVFSRLLTFPNVVVTAHQAFFTRNALEAIAAQTVRNLVHFQRGEPLEAVVNA